MQKHSGGKEVQKLVKMPSWQRLRESLVGTWKETPAANVKKLREFLGDNPSEDKLRIMLNYLTGSGFRIGIITHPEITKLRESVKKKLEKIRKNKKVASNKFNIAWQIVRVEARAIKDVQKKVDHVMSYLKKNPNKHNYDRVMNWLKMTQLGYKQLSPKDNPFEKAIDHMTNNKSRYDDPDDNEMDLKDVSTENLEMVRDDLSKRKYQFQYDRTPKAHTEFMEKLEEELASR